MMKTKTATNDFLSALLFVSENAQHKSISDFTLQFQKYVEGFIDGFIKFLQSKSFDMERLNDLERSFGGNIYFSLSGHGCGFFDEYGDKEKTLGKELQALIEEYSGNKYRFEELEYNIRILRGGKISLAVRIQKKDFKDFFERYFKV